MLLFGLAFAASIELTMIVTTWLVIFVIRTTVVFAMIKPRLTIASCVSNLEAFEACLLESISSLRSDLEINILPIYNPNNIYSASVAANLAMEVCRDRFLLYVHQDVKFLPDAAEMIATILKHWPKNTAVVGAAGVKDYVTIDIAGPWGLGLRKDNLIGSVYDNNELIWDGDIGFHPTQSVDEVFMLLDTHSGIRFDPSWPGYHLYGLDFCLQARSAAFGVMCANIPIEHVGRYSASLYRDNNFMGRLIALYKKWGSRFSHLFAPYCHWDNNRIASYIPFALKDQFNQRIDIPRLSVTVSNELCISPPPK